MFEKELVRENFTGNKSYFHTPIIQVLHNHLHIHQSSSMYPKNYPSRLMFLTPELYSFIFVMPSSRVHTSLSVEILSCVANNLMEAE